MDLNTLRLVVLNLVKPENFKFFDVIEKGFQLPDMTLHYSMLHDMQSGKSVGDQVKILGFNETYIIVAFVTLLSVREECDWYHSGHGSYLRSTFARVEGRFCFLTPENSGSTELVFYKREDDNTGERIATLVEVSTLMVV